MPAVGVQGRKSIKLNGDSQAVLPRLDGEPEVPALGRYFRLGQGHGLAGGGRQQSDLVARFRDTLGLARPVSRYATAIA